MAFALPGARSVSARTSRLCWFSSNRSRLHSTKTYVRQEHQQSPEKPGVGQAWDIFIQQYATETAVGMRTRFARHFSRAGTDCDCVAFVDTRYCATRHYHAAAR